MEEHWHELLLQMDWRNSVSVNWNEALMDVFSPNTGDAYTLGNFS